uniref:Uncharacterized protein n=1 Tax=Myoviridae sp. ctxbQ4 TaxID=2827292 RepID=A0A8S5R5J2_9CAUD|nr:MAG TPA: hypothetical protein [Myoviridae sp. ctxbQ4]
MSASPRQVKLTHMRKFKAHEGVALKSLVDV